MSRRTSHSVHGVGRVEVSGGAGDPAGGPLGRVVVEGEEVHRSALPVQDARPAHHLVRRDVLDVAGDGPAVPEGIDDETVAVAVELVGGGSLECGAE